MLSYCDRCGSACAVGTAVCPNCGATEFTVRDAGQVAVGTAVCPNCGATEFTVRDAGQVAVEPVAEAAAQGPAPLATPGPDSTPPVSSPGSSAPADDPGEDSGPAGIDAEPDAAEPAWPVPEAGAG